MLIGDITNAGAIPVLEMTAKFAAARQRVIAHNVANIDTPGFLPLDLSTTEFQNQLRSAVEDRRTRNGSVGELKFKGTDQVRVGSDGQLRIVPKSSGGNILFHDRNNRDLERLMQSNAENVAVFRVSTELLRSRYDILRSAMAERV